MAVFASGKMNMLVVTSAVSRGLNITVPVNLIINYDLPRDVQDFYERVCKYPTLIYNITSLPYFGVKLRKKKPIVTLRLPIVTLR